MIRTHLLGAVSAAALACISTASFAVTHASLPTIVFGGSSLVGNDLDGAGSITGELISFNTKYATSGTVSTFGNSGNTAPYYIQGSGAGREAVLYNNLLCLTTNNCKISGGVSPTAAAGGANVVHMGASDAVLISDEWNIWNGTYSGTASSTTNFGYSTAGNLIQIPSVGVGITLAVNLIAHHITKNGQLTLTDSQVCGIFSGKITDWGAISSTLGNGSNNPITVVYRSDSSGTSALFTAHLTQVCTSSNSNFLGATSTGLTNSAAWSPSSYTFGAGHFTSMFGTGAVMPSTGFNAQTGSSAIASTIVATPGAIGYVTPDVTSLTVTGKSVNPTLYVAGVEGAGESTFTTPTAANITLGLEHGDASVSYFTVPPTISNFSQQDVWTPILPKVTSGYPIVGYTTFLFPQCFASKAVAAGVKDFLNLHYGNAAYKKIQTTDNGFVPLASSNDEKIIPIIEDNIVNNTNGWNYNVNNTTACLHLGR